MNQTSLEERMARIELEERMTRIEGILEQIDKRISNLESRFNLVLGILIPMWVTIILAIIFK